MASSSSTTTTNTRDKSPTPSERTRLDAEAKALEDAEQATLPYKWTQTLTEAEVTIPIPSNLKSKDLNIILKKSHITVAIKGPNQSPIIEGDTPFPLSTEDSTWTLSTTTNGAKEVVLTLAKAQGSNWWPHIVTNAPKIDVTKIVPENSKLSDLDGQTRGMVEKMMYDQEMKRQGKPTSEEQQKQDMLKKFMEQHPEMDFSGAKMG